MASNWCLYKRNEAKTMRRVTSMLMKLTESVNSETEKEGVDLCDPS